VVATTAFRVIGETVTAGSDTSSVGFTYDGDGVLTSAGAMRLGASSDDGQFTDSTLARASELYGYNAYAELAIQQSVVNGVEVLLETYDSANAPRE
jgi:hypothetical protein